MGASTGDRNDDFQDIDISGIPHPHLGTKYPLRRNVIMRLTAREPIRDSLKAAGKLVL
jgi:hypothetical protein